MENGRTICRCSDVCGRSSGSESRKYWSGSAIAARTHHIGPIPIPIPIPTRTRKTGENWFPFWGRIGWGGWRQHRRPDLEEAVRTVVEIDKSARNTRVEKEYWRCSKNKIKILNLVCFVLKRRWVVLRSSWFAFRSSHFIGTRTFLISNSGHTFFYLDSGTHDACA